MMRQKLMNSQNNGLMTFIYNDSVTNMENLIFQKAYDADMITA
jgi:hypothetical protein